MTGADSDCTVKSQTILGRLEVLIPKQLSQVITGNR